MTRPLLSYILLVYNYENYVGKAIQSVLDQSVQDFEIVVVDDASKDRSRAVVEAFNDPRIRIHSNETNLGGAASYNIAVTMACGEYLVNLDADDWVAPLKAERQLAAFAADPTLDIVGTYVSYVDASGEPHVAAAQLETHTNQPFNFNYVDTWIVKNSLCRSSTMMRRDTHLRIGLDDPTMFRCVDYELWTRALRLGCRFGMVQEPLTYYRLHSRGETFVDPLATTLEIAYLMRRNIIPLIESRSLYVFYDRIYKWLHERHTFLGLPAQNRYRLFGYLAQSKSEFENYAIFRDWVLAETPDPLAQAVGRNIFSLLQCSSDKGELRRLYMDVGEHVRGIEWWKQQAQNWQAAHDTVVQSLTSEVEYWKQQAQNWQAAHATSAQSLTSDVEFWKQQAQNWQAAHATSAQSLTSDVEFWKQQAQNWQAAHDTSAQSLTSDVEFWKQQAQNWELSCRNSPELNFDDKN